jgi:hypothetical protein
MIPGSNFKYSMLLTVALLSIGNVNVVYAVGGESTDGEWEYSLAPLFLWAQGIQGSSQIGSG